MLANGSNIRLWLCKTIAGSVVFALIIVISTCYVGVYNANADELVAPEQIGAEDVSNETQAADGEAADSEGADGEGADSEGAQTKFSNEVNIEGNVSPAEPASQVSALSAESPAATNTNGEEIDADRNDKITMSKSWAGGKWIYSAETNITDYTVLGAVWGTYEDHKSKGDGDGEKVEVHTQSFINSTWSALEEAQDDCSSGSFGTDPILMNSNGAVRLILSTVADLGDVTMSVIQEKTTAKDVEVTNADKSKLLTRTAISTFNAGNKPAVHSRYEWGADDNQMNLHDAWPSWDVGYCRDKAGMQPNVYRGAVIHHTAGSNNYSQAEVPSIIRSVFNYHAISLQWGDIGYNFLVDKYGGIWEGRYGSMNTTAVGYHALPHANCSTFGVSVLGEYGAAGTTTPMINALIDVISWKFAQYGINPQGYTTMGRDGGWSWLPTIVGHRDVGATACPGQNLYNQIPYIRSAITVLSVPNSVYVPDGE